MNVSQLNPVLDLELRQRSRKVWSLVVMIGFLLFTIGILFLSYQAEKSADLFAFDPVSAASQTIGRSMMEWVLLCELGVLLLVIPGISAASVASERSRQTLVPLQVTLLRPWQVYWGKVLASSAFALLLIVMSIPVLAVSYLLGGVSIGAIVAGGVAALILGLVYSAIGVTCSTVFRRVQTAILASYALVATLTIGTVVALIATAVIDQSRGSDAAEPVVEVLYPNPVVFVAAVAGDEDGRGATPLSSLRQELARAGREPDFVGVDGAEEVGMVEVGPGDDLAFAPAGMTEDEVGWEAVEGVGPRRTWLWSGLVQVGLLVVSALVGVRGLRMPRAELER
ncbi:MAG: ABC transporter permease [Acidimicrobiales bacterium]